MGKTCCVCSSSQQNCKMCECAKNGMACIDCRKGPDCKNIFGRRGNESQGAENKEGRAKRNGINAVRTTYPENAQDVKGDGNCFFRCIALSLYESEEQHETIRKKVVHEINSDERYYKEYMDKEIKEHVNDMSRSNGGTATWATEAEVLATAECYKIDIFVYIETGDHPDWLRYTKDWKCHHKRKYIKILCTGSHYKLVHDPGRPCKCAERNQNSGTTRPTLNDVLHSQPHHTGHIEDESEQEQDTSTHSVQESRCNLQTAEDGNQSPAVNRSNEMDLNRESIVEKMYNDILHFHSYNMFMPNTGHALDKMKIEMTKLINEYVTDSPAQKLSLKMLMSMPKLLLQKEHRRAKAKENNSAFKRRMEAWMRCEYEELLEEAHAIQERLGQRDTSKIEEEKARRFRKKMETGQVRQASRMLQNDSKQGMLPVNEENMKKLREKHPEGAEASDEALIEGVRENAHSVIFNCIDGEMIKRAATDTKGSAGPSGMDANIWRMLLTSRRNSNISMDLRNAIAHLARKMCVERCQYLDPITNSRLIPLKNPNGGVRPIGVGEVLRRIIGRCVQKVLKEDIQNAVGNLQTCAGQKAGAEAAIHAMREIYNEDECEAVILIDASNAFNTLNRKAMLHNIGIICPSISNFVKNTYMAAPRLIISKGNDLTSKEGTTQGDPIAMAIYALGLSALQMKIDYEHTGAKHVAYADDLAGAGSLRDVKKFWDETQKKGPAIGYHPNADKSCLIIKPGKEIEAREIFSGTGVRITTEGHKHLGAVIGSQEYKDTYVNELVNGWIQEIRELSEIAKTEPHSAYTNFIFSMKQKWNFAMRTIPGIGQHLQPLEASIRKEFLPSLFSFPMNDRTRDLIALPARMGGLGITNPVNIADEEHKNSIHLTATLKDLIIKQDKNGVANHNELKEITKQISKEKEERQRQDLQEIQNSEYLGIKEKKKLEMSLERGASNWLTTLPIKVEGFSLNKEEFHIAMAARYGFPIQRLPEYCACGSTFTVDHSMICKRGGYVTQRHNELRDTTNQMMSEVCKNVESEPVLQPLTGEKFKHSTAITKDNARLDLSADGFWTRGERAFFDVRVFDPVAQSHIGQSLQAAHRKQEESKRLCYEERIINVEHASFTPLVFTIAGGMGKAAQNFYNRLADMIAESREQPKSVVVAWMRSRLSFSLVRSAVRCIRGTRRRATPAPVKDTDIQAAVSVSQIPVKEYW